jgi:hypothetical protein
MSTFAHLTRQELEFCQSHNSSLLVTDQGSIVQGNRKILRSFLTNKTINEDERPYIVALERRIITAWILDWEKRKANFSYSGFSWVNPFQLPAMIRGEFVKHVFDKVLLRQFGRRAGDYEIANLDKFERAQLFDDIETVLKENSSIDNRSMVRSAGQS